MGNATREDVPPNKLEVQPCSTLCLATKRDIADTVPSELSTDAGLVRVARRACQVHPIHAAFTRPYARVPTKLLMHFLRAPVLL
jgi:hypothetical protein